MRLERRSLARVRKKTLNITFGIGLIVSLILSFVSYKQINTLIASNKLVLHTYEVIDNLQYIANKLLTIETDGRAYLLTSNLNFLQTHLTNINLTYLALTKVFNLVSDNKPQQQRINDLRNLIDKRFSNLQKLIYFKDSGKLFSKEGMDAFSQSSNSSLSVLAALNEIRSIEYILLSERNRLKISHSRNASIVLLTGSLLITAFLFWIMVVANLEFARRRSVENKNRTTEDTLYKIISSSHDMIAALNFDHELILFNDHYANNLKKWFGVSVNIGMNLDEVLSSVSGDKAVPAMEFAKTLHQEIVGKRIEIANGIYELNSSHFNGESNFKGYIQYIHDITGKIKEHQALKESYDKMQKSVKELEFKNEQITLLVDLSDVMLATSSLTELTKIIEGFAVKLIKDTSGNLYIMHASKNHLEKIATFVNPNLHQLIIEPDQCWAIRLGHTHITNQKETLICEHLKENQNPMKVQMCIPLMAQNDIYGLLYLESFQENFPTPDQSILITAFSELVSLGLSNIRLRENLRYQTLRDPLTGLYNRRYLEDFLSKFVNQSQRTRLPLSILMIDLDHFKRINDSFGHEAGDAVIKALSDVLTGSIREGDIAVRYGGEEFLIVFYDIDLESTRSKAESIRREVSHMQVKYGAQIIGPITVSIGISAFPIDAETPEGLIAAADKALYESKNKGRNQVTLFSNIVD